MSLVRMINGLINDIGIISDGNIKSRLTKLRQKVEAQETRLKDLKAKIVKLEAQAKKKKLVPKQGGFKKVEFLKLLAEHEALTVRRIAEALGISKIKAEHYK